MPASASPVSLQGQSPGFIAETGAKPEISQRLLALFGLLALVDRLHAVLRAGTGGARASLLAGAYARIDIAIDSPRRRRKGNRGAVNECRGQQRKQQTTQHANLQGTELAKWHNRAGRTR
jgi:hypothetical protein